MATGSAGSFCRARSGTGNRRAVFDRLSRATEVVSASVSWSVRGGVGVLGRGDGRRIGASRLRQARQARAFYLPKIGPLEHATSPLRIRTSISTVQSPADAAQSSHPEFSR